MPKYIDATRMLIEENEAYLSAHSKITDELTRKVNYVIHTKLQQLLSDAPAEDVVEVVRCRDCKYRSKNTQWTRAGYCGRRQAGDFFVAPPDGYCSYGERKESSDENQT